MKLLFDARVLEQIQPTGVSSVAQNLLLEFSKRSDLEITLFSSSHQKPRFQSTLPRVHIPLSNAFLALLWNIPKIQFHQKYFKDFDIVFSPHIDILPTISIPRVIMVHDVAYLRFHGIENGKSRLWHHLMSSSFFRADRIVVPSYSTFDDLIELLDVNPEHVHKVHYGGGPQVFPAPDCDILSKYGVSEKEYFLVLGDISHRKNTHSIIMSYLQYRKRVQNPKPLVVVGKHMTGTKQQSNFDGVKFLGYIDEISKQELLRKSLALFYPSFYEGLGMPVLEALREGVPVVTSKVSSLVEVGGLDVWYVDPFSIESITEAFIKAENGDIPMPSHEAKIRSQIGFTQAAEELVQIFYDLIG